MLKHLHIRHFAIVDTLELELYQGMTVLTGETGAGKSILIDALNLALGERADSSVVRPGCERAEISASFTTNGNEAARRWLQERELDADEECVVRRTVSPDGRSRGYINGQPMPIQALRELGDRLVDIHGQHAHQSLLKREVQRELLDAYAGHTTLVAEVRKGFRHWRELSETYAELSQAGQERDARRELLVYQVNELQALGLGPGELEELDQEHNRLANANRLLEGGQGALDLLYENEELAVSNLLERVLGALQELQDVDPSLIPSCELLEGAAIQIQEAATELRHYLSGVELDPERLAWAEQRLADIHALARKHRVVPDELPQLLEEMSTELAELSDSETRLEELGAEISTALDHYREQAAALTAGRTAAAQRLGEQVSANMQELGMGGGRFHIALEPRDDAEPAATGNELVEFQVTANPGQPLRPLNKVASGGELSRISLAIQVITADAASVPTLIFDEVDVGIGGGVAEMVGRQLRAVGESRQVMCVTHQAQVAALGHNHLQVSKHSDGETTSSTIDPLDPEQRVEEIARMLGGVTITEQTRSHAREMLGAPAKRRRKA